MFFTDLSKAERKKCVKEIEKHLKNYNNYKIAILNIEKQLDFASSVSEENSNYHISPVLSSKETVSTLENELTHLEILKDSIDRSLSELNELERQFVEYRYFKKWSIEKIALNIGYSDKALFVIRNQIMEKLIISLGSLLYSY